MNGVQNWQNGNIEHSPIRSNGNALATLVPIPPVIAIIWSTKHIAALAEFDQAVGQFVVVEARGGYLASEPGFVNRRMREGLRRIGPRAGIS